MPIRPRTPQRTSRSVFWGHWTVWIWFVLALVLCVGCVALWKSGRWLVREDRFDHVRWGIVLAGESRDCERSDAAIRMFHDGKIDTLVISATRVFKNRYNSEFMVDYYVQQGVPRDRVFEFRQDAYSTLEEARLLIRQFRLQNLDTALIVTTSYHTARTRRIFRKLAQGYPVVLVAAADYSIYDPNAWWTNRESRKTWFDEWAKTIFTYYELAKAPPENGKAEFQGLTPDIWSSRGPADNTRPSGNFSDTLVRPAPLKTDSAAALPPPPGGLSGSDTGKGGMKEGTSAAEAEAKAEIKAEAKTAEIDSALNAKADSARLHKDSLKTAENRTSAEGKVAAKDSTAKKSLPKAEKKPAAAKETRKPGVPVKVAAKAAEKKTEKEKEKEKAKAKKKE